MSSIYSRRWTQPECPKLDGMYDDITRLRCGGRPRTLCERKKEIKTTWHLNPVHPPVNACKRFMKSGYRLEPDQVYEKMVRCSICKSGSKEIVTIPPKTHVHLPIIGEDQYLTTEERKLEHLMNKAFQDWLLKSAPEDYEKLNRSVVLAAPKMQSHHRRHHDVTRTHYSIRRSRTTKEKKKTGKDTIDYSKYTICCADCDYPYQMYRRRYPPHIYNPVLVKLPIKAKTSIDSKHQNKFELKQYYTDMERLQRALESHRFEEVRQVSNTFYASFLENWEML